MVSELQDLTQPIKLRIHCLVSLSPSIILSLKWSRDISSHCPVLKSSNHDVLPQVKTLQAPAYGLIWNIFLIFQLLIPSLTHPFHHLILLQSTVPVPHSTKFTIHKLETSLMQCCLRAVHFLPHQSHHSKVHPEHCHHLNSMLNAPRSFSSSATSESDYPKHHG